MTVVATDNPHESSTTITTTSVQKENRPDEEGQPRWTNSMSLLLSFSDLPEWVREQQDSWGEPLEVEEWKDHDSHVVTPSSHISNSGGGDGGGYLSEHVHRRQLGWKGRDLIHDVYSPVRILQYHVQYGPGLLSSGHNDDTDDVKDDDQGTSLQPRHQQRGGIGTTLTGVVHFTTRAESHAGYCHGGSMTSVLDDVIGWNAFLVTGLCRPWTGFTVQVHTNLVRPIPVDSLLVVQATIVGIVRRKVSIEAVLYDPMENTTPTATTTPCDQNNNNNNHETKGSSQRFSSTIRSSAIHATAQGLVVMNRGVLPAEYDRSSTMSTSSSSSLMG
jgi:acyl-CoA hydrolase